MRILQVVGYKNAGKTTLVCEIVRMLAENGVRTGTLKRDAHDAIADVSGTDSWRHREAGAAATALTSGSRTAFFEERPSELPELLENMRARGIEAVVVEGFKEAAYPKIVLLRDAADTGMLALSGVVACASQTPLSSAYQSVMPDIPFFLTADFHFGPVVAFAKNHLL